jgi:opacity protein-like surface antigen
MVRTRFMLSALAALAVLAASAAHAADYHQPPPPPQYIPPPPPPQECCSSWYLRGFVGAGMMKGSDAVFIQNPANSSNFVFDSTSYSDHMFIGGGVGYAVNNWLRIEGTAEYRAKSRIYAFGHYTDDTGFFLDTYEGNLSSWVFLANAFVDLGTWDCWTPFVGAGVGAARNTISNFTDINPSNAGFGLGTNPSEWHLAWALYAGVSYAVSKSLSVDFTYRYLSYGSITDSINCFSGCNAPDSFKFDKLHSNDFMIGLRWTCCDTAPPPPRYVYQPQPYMPPPPPLQSRG